MTLDQINEAITRSEVASGLLLIVISLVIIIELLQRKTRAKR